MKKRLIVSLILALALVLSFGLSACGETPAPPHEHTWSTEWTKDENYHWHRPKCFDTAEVNDKAEHSFVDGECSVCGYVLLHRHVWSTEWSKDEKCHWHAALCDDTTEVKDRAAHKFVNGICSKCGFDEKGIKHKHDFVNNVCTECGELRDVSDIDQTPFKDLGEKYSAAVKPVYDAVQTILQDLLKDEGLADVKDKLTDEARNPRIEHIVYSDSLDVYINFDVFILEEEDYDIKNGEKSEFLKNEVFISVKNFSKTDETGSLEAFQDFVRAEHKLQGGMHFEEKVLPYAKRSAETLLERYEIYKNSEDKEIKFYNRGKLITISQGSSLPEVYGKTVAKLNGVLEEKGYPLLTDQDIQFRIGGHRGDDGILYISLQITANIGSLYYSFFIDITDYEVLSYDDFCHFHGAVSPAYGTYPDWYNPQNGEYAEYFEKLKIEEKDFRSSSIEDPLHFYSYELHF